MSDAAPYEALLALYDEARHNLAIFMDGVSGYIGRHPKLTLPGSEIVHSYKSRLKDREHLRAKIARKIADGQDIDDGNFFAKITDLAGVRILHLFQQNFGR
jgi:putative GTP pyrophosphokinase